MHHTIYVNIVERKKLSIYAIYLLKYLILIKIKRNFKILV